MVFSLFRFPENTENTGVIWREVSYFGSSKRLFDSLVNGALGAAACPGASGTSDKARYPLVCEGVVMSHVQRDQLPKNTRTAIAVLVMT